MSKLETKITYVNLSLLDFCWRLFPVPYPKKQIANIGETPTKGASIPLYNPVNPSFRMVLMKQSKVPLKRGFSPGKGTGCVCSLTYKTNIRTCHISTSMGTNNLLPHTWPPQVSTLFFGVVALLTLHLRKNTFCYGSPWNQAVKFKMKVQGKVRGFKVTCTYISPRTRPLKKVRPL